MYMYQTYTIVLKDVEGNVVAQETDTFMYPANARKRAKEMREQFDYDTSVDIFEHEKDGRKIQSAYCLPGQTHFRI